MVERLNLSMESELKKFLKQYAKETGKSISEIVSLFAKDLKSNRKWKPKINKKWKNFGSNFKLPTHKKGDDRYNAIMKSCNNG
ncbi:MAG: DUF6364 family protein [Chitinispirillia bacterium]|jgi:hypothetical protein